MKSYHRTELKVELIELLMRLVYHTTLNSNTGVVERKNKTLKGMAKIMMRENDLLKSFGVKL